jgi:hypothetical protein
MKIEILDDYYIDLNLHKIGYNHHMEVIIDEAFPEDNEWFALGDDIVTLESKCGKYEFVFRSSADPDIADICEFDDGWGMGGCIIYLGGDYNNPPVYIMKADISKEMYDALLRIIIPNPECLNNFKLI